jgi:cyclophilin family peptidyl-prolyl cis-trans isomerase
MFVPNGTLNGQYSIWGRVISGMNAVDAIAPGEPPAQPTKIVRAYLGDMAAQPAP